MLDILAPELYVRALEFYILALELYIVALELCTASQESQPDLTSGTQLYFISVDMSADHRSAC